MSELPPQVDLQYESNAYGNAPLLVQLSYIFLYIIGGIDFLAAPLYIGYIFFFAAMMRRIPPAGPGAPPPPLSVNVLVYAMYGTCSFVSLLQGILKMIAATKLRRHSPGAWGWGLAAGIAACLELECSIMCVLPLAAGIYTIVILSQDRVRSYLRTRSFPLQA